MGSSTFRRSNASRREPSQAPLAGVARDGGLALPGNHVVELHDDVGAEVPLDAHHALGREPPARAVDVALELDALLLYGAQPGEREDLKASRVGEDRTIPVHELVQPAQLAYQLVARTQVQVIRVGEDHLRVHRAQVVGVQRLHGGERADRHECGRLDDAVRRDEASGARGAGGLLESEVEAHAGNPAGQTIAIASPYE